MHLLPRLKDLADGTNRFGHINPSFARSLSTPVQQCVVGPSHIALLLEDGRVGRLPFSVLPDGLDLTKSSSKNVKGSGLSNRQTCKRGRLLKTSNSRGATNSSTRTAVAHPSGTTSRGVIMPSSQPVFVPEELVSQVQVVLQGKSRSIITRELQKTNLDVNQAVNNLLSRDDDESEDEDDSQDSFIYESLISQLDPRAGLHRDHSEPSVVIEDESIVFKDMFGYSTSRSQHSGTNPTQSGTHAGGKSSDGAGGGTSERNRGSKKKESSTSQQMQNPLVLSDEIEFWPEKPINSEQKSTFSSGSDAAPRFTSIAAMYSELIALSTTGQILSWKWTEPEPLVQHPRGLRLGLHVEKVAMLSASVIRCTVVTESGKVASWLDETVAHVPGITRLQHAAQHFTEFLGERIISLDTCSLYSAVRLENGAIYWWGVLPPGQRRKLWDKYKTEAKKSPPSSAAVEIVPGAQVIKMTTHL